MATFDAYKIVSAHDSSLLGVVWWDGERVRASDARTLRFLKNSMIGSLYYEDGESFFRAIPRLYSSGYEYTRKTKVDKEGNEVNV